MQKNIKTIDGGVTAPKGFLAAAAAAGIKYEGRNDVAILVSETDCVSAATYTKNVVKAAPVLFDKKRTDSDTPIRAVVANAGNANACTGDEGNIACEKTAKAAAEASRAQNDPTQDTPISPAPFDETKVLVASTGVIGVPLPIEKLESGIKEMSKNLSATRESANAAARAIMTTDTLPKEAAVQLELGGKTVTIAGMSKGSGMIHPNMGTMLAFVTTDAAIEKPLLQAALSDVVEDTFNMITVDGDTSTNDTCIVLANGQAENQPLTKKDEDYEIFRAALKTVCETLAKKMAGDGEGATALFEVKVIHADTKENAKILAKSVAGSNLTKAAIYGHDANWGRILCALGYSGVDFNPEKVDLTFESKNGKIEIAKAGRGTNFDEEKATEILTAEAVTAICDMNMGDANATAWGCDLTHEYVSINADYRS